MNLRAFLGGSIPALLLIVSACAAERTDQGGNDQSTEVQPANTVAPSDAPYAFGAPDLRVELPGELLEISAVTALPDGNLAAVQDESGIVFVINGQTGEVEREVEFGDPADYEGIAWTGDRLWVLRSNGRLFELNGWPDTELDVHEIRTPLRGRNDTEGLAYDAQENRLLIALKEDPGNGLDEDLKAVYAFDLESRSFVPDPVYTIDTNELEDTTPIDSKFKPSDIAVHPVTDEIYLLSATATGIVVLDRAGTVKTAWQLDEDMFEQAEGLTFLPDGTLFVSSEGQDGPGMLYRYALQQQ